MNGSIGQLPAPAPWPASEASTRVTPSSTATTELATARERFWCAWMPIWVSGSQDVPVGADPLADAVHGEPAAGVGDVYAVGAVGLHERGLPGELVCGGQVAHHQEPGDVHAEVPGGADVLGRDVGLGAVGRDADRADTEGVGVLQLGDRADTGQQQGREGGAGRCSPRPPRSTPSRCCCQGRSSSSRPRARRRARPRWRRRRRRRARRRCGRRLRGDAVPDGVHAVPQRDVLDVQRGRGRGHAATSTVRR